MCNKWTERAPFRPFFSLLLTGIVYVFRPVSFRIEGAEAMWYGSRKNIHLFCWEILYLLYNTYNRESRVAKCRNFQNISWTPLCGSQSIRISSHFFDLWLPLFHTWNATHFSESNRNWSVVFGRSVRRRERLLRTYVTVLFKFPVLLWIFYTEFKRELCSVHVRSQSIQLCVYFKYCFFGHLKSLGKLDSHFTV